MDNTLVWTQARTGRRRPKGPLTRGPMRLTRGRHSQQGVHGAFVKDPRKAARLKLLTGMQATHIALLHSAWASQLHDPRIEDPLRGLE